MNLQNIVNLWKPALKGLIVVLLLVASVELTVTLVSDLYDLRQVLSVAFGALLFQPVYSLFARLNILQ